MIGVKIGNTFADVYKDTKVTLLLNNPLLNDDNLSPGSSSDPFDLPAGDESPTNDELLGTPDVIENSDGFRKVDAELLIEDLPFRKGQLVTSQIVGSKVSTNYIFGLSTISPEFKTKKLRDLLDETVTIHNVNVGKKIFIKPGPGGTSPYTINVNGKSYSGATLPALADAITANTEGATMTANYVATGATFLGMTAPYIEILPHSPADALSPLHVAPDNNLFENFVWLAHAFDPTVYNNGFAAFYASHAADARFRFLNCANNNPYGEDIKPEYYSDYYLSAGFGSYAGGTKVTNYVNATSGGNFLMNDPNYGYSINQPFRVKNQNSIQPTIRLRHILNTIGTYFGMDYEGDFMDLPDIDKMMFWNTAYLDIPLDFLGTQKFVFFRNSFNIKELVPDITVREFFMALQSRYNLGIRLNEQNGKLRMVKRENLVKQYVYEDITSRCGTDPIKTDLRVTGYKLIAPKDDTDRLAVEDIKEVDIPEQDIPVTLKAFQSFGNITVSQKIGDKCDLTIFYEKISFGARIAQSNSDNWIESLGAANGIYETFWKFWLFFQKRQWSIKLNVDFSVNDLRELHWENRYRFDRKDFLIKTIRVDVDKNGVGTSEVELYSIF